MCIIIDANTSPHFKNNTAEVQFIVNWIISGKGRLETGGLNLTEMRSCSLRSLLQQFTLAGRVKTHSTENIEQHQKRLDVAKMKSDDPHILALALESGCRLLFSHDKGLHIDFTGPHHLKPKGKVFQCARRHSALLKGAKKVKMNP